jgi:hypothetical protein
VSPGGTWCACEIFRRCRSAITAILTAGRKTNLLGRGIRLNDHIKGAWRDNAFVERLWRSVKYEEVYLKAYDSASKARASIACYLDF